MIILGASGAPKILPGPLLAEEEIILTGNEFPPATKYNNYTIL
jgi:hypothetical protein